MEIKLSEHDYKTITEMVLKHHNHAIERKMEDVINLHLIDIVRKQIDSDFEFWRSYMHEIVKKEIEIINKKSGERR